MALCMWGCGGNKMAKTDPLICEVTRGTMVESVHRVHAIAMDSSGIVQQWGDADLMMYPRSAIKYMQGIPLVELGAADAWALSGEETALACASHSGAREHVAAVSSWLGRMGLGEGDLACGAHLPYDQVIAHEMIQAYLYIFLCPSYIQLFFPLHRIVAYTLIMFLIA